MRNRLKATVQQALTEAVCNKVLGCGRLIQDVEFRDEVSEREYRISGLCQDCQDFVFGVDSEM
jgi:hypothetical protein